MNARETVLNPSSQHFFELDILIPDLNLGFEFQVYIFSFYSFLSLLAFINASSSFSSPQDLYHFSTTWYYQSPIDVIKSRDSIHLIDNLHNSV